MATLQLGDSSTVQAIYEAVAATHKHFDVVGLSMSDLGSECDRALWYTLRWASEPEEMTGKKKRRLNAGNITEQRIIEELKLVPGVMVLDIDPERDGKQFKIYSHGGHVRGKLDGKAHGLPEAPATWHVVECKLLKAEDFRAVVKHGLKAKKLGHWRQCQIYMHRTGLTRALYICQNGDTDELHTERLEYDPVEVMKLNVRLENIIAQNTAPSRIAKSADKWPCLFCRHKAVCHQETLGRNHCRTCIHSTPQINHDDTSAPWLCEKFGRTLSIDEQKAGCHAHLFLPDVVPGDQIDSNGVNIVVYRMRDGSEWVDCEQPEPQPIRYWWHSYFNELMTTNGNHPNPDDDLWEELQAEEYATACEWFKDQQIKTEENAGLPT